MKKIISLFINIFICHFLYNVRYEKLDIIKEMDKCIICPNHSHIFDPVWIYPQISDIHIMAKSELFKNKIASKLLYYFGAFPIKRGKKDAKSLIYAIKVLKINAKSRLIIFPEGGILSEEKRRKYITDGATYIAAKTKIPIIPVYITEKPKIFSKVCIKFENAIQIDENTIKNKDLLHKKSQELLYKIYSMENN